MLNLPKKKTTLVFFVSLLFIFYFLLSAFPALAAWRVDAEVTEVGRNAERARELLYWLFTHPSLDMQSVGIRQIWVIARNVVYILFIIVLIGGGLWVMFFRARGFNIAAWIPKIIALLVFVTFSYIFVVGLVQIGDMMMRFFIEIAGCNLFNIHFAGPGSSCTFSPAAIKEMEKNYTEFIGYRYYDETASLVSNESANVSLWLIRFTTFTYNVMSIALVLRKVILWYLIVISPFLAILAPFIFIRNIAWIWIGVFFQWLFYGPMMALFLSGLVKIWETGIPYGFDWARRDAIQAGSEEWVFPTVINILVGGPAQTLTTRNSLNFVDTYAEYIIALVMLWTAIFLPWLLLRIFRDYCCGSVRAAVQAQAPAIWGLYDEIRKWGGPPAPPEAPTAAAPTAAQLELPYRRPAVVPTAITAQDVARISRQETREIIRALGLAIPSIRDVALADINMQKRRMMEKSLQALKAPATLASEAERRKFTALRQELRSRALKGDIAAQRVVSAVEREAGAVFRPALVPRAEQLSASERLAIAERQIREKKLPISIPTVGTDVQKLEQIEKEAKEKGVPLYIPTLARTRPLAASERLGLAKKQIEEKKLPISIPTVGTDAQKLAHIEKEAKEKGIPLYIPTTTRIERAVAVPAKPGVPPVMVPGVPPAPRVSVEDYEEVKKMWVNNYRLAEVPVSEKIKTRKDWLKHDITQITNTVDLLASALPEMKKKGLDQVAEILPFLLLGGFTQEETITYLKAKLEAAKLVLEELEKIEKAKKEVKEEEEELVKVPVEVEKEEEKALEAVRKLAEEIPEAKPAPAKAPPRKPRTFKKRKTGRADIDTADKD